MVVGNGHTARQLVHGIAVSASHLLLRFLQKSQLRFALFLFSAGSGLEAAGGCGRPALGSRSVMAYQTTSVDISMMELWTKEVHQLLFFFLFGNKKK